MKKHLMLQYDYRDRCLTVRDDLIRPLPKGAFRTYLWWSIAPASVLKTELMRATREKYLAEKIHFGPLHTSATNRLIPPTVENARQMSRTMLVLYPSLLAGAAVLNLRKLWRVLTCARTRQQTAIQYAKQKAVLDTAEGFNEVVRGTKEQVAEDAELRRRRYVDCD